jgi:hypothetical protein
MPKTSAVSAGLILLLGLMIARPAEAATVRIMPLDPAGSVA